jgi:hypothetical protein
MMVSFSAKMGTRRLLAQASYVPAFPSLSGQWLQDRDWLISGPGISFPSQLRVSRESHPFPLSRPPP